MLPISLLVSTDEKKPPAKAGGFHVSNQRVGLATDSTTAAAHQVKEFSVVLGLTNLVEQEFHRFDFVHVVNELAQHPNLLQQVRLDQQFFATRAGLVQVDRRIH